jgi:hypothetical protein
MPAIHKTAILKFNSLEGVTVDPEKFVVKGCQLAKLGKLAVFRDLNGNKQEILITPRVVTGLLSLFLADNRGDAHWTHDWKTKGEDGIASKVATWRNFRVNDEGDLLADAYLWPSDKREAIMYAAQHDREGMMISTVFNYDGGKNDAVPTSIMAADFVEKGAATTALCAAFAKLSEDTTQNKKPMEISELIEMLKDPQCQDAVKAIIKSHNAAEPSPDKAVEADNEKLAVESEADAGVTAEDKKPEDEKKPALMRAAVRICRVISRQAKTIHADKTAILAEAKVAAAAELTSKIGNTAFLSQFTPGAQEATDFEGAVAQEIGTGAKSRAEAIRFVARKKPDLYNKARAAGKV